MFLFDVIANGNDPEIEDYPVKAAAQPATPRLQDVIGQFTGSEFMKKVSH